MKDGKYLKILFLIIFIFFLPHLINPNLLTSRDNDLGRNYVPIFSFIQRSVLVHHQIPLWRPDQLMGESFIANPVYSPFYPANIIFLFLPVELGSIIYYLLHFLIAAYSTYYLAKSFSLSREASFAAALFYGLSFKMLVHLEAGHITMVAAFSLFPLVFLSFRKLFLKYEPKWLAAASVSLALTYLAYPTISYYVFIFISAYWVYQYVFNFKNKRHKFLKSWLLYTSAIVLAVFIMAIELLPHLEFAPLSTRSQLKLEDVALPLWNFKKFVMSLLFPYLEKSLDHEAFLYLGLVPTTLAVMGFLFLSRLKKIIIFGAFLFMLLYVSGLSTPLFPFLYDHVPLLNYSRITTRPWFIMALLAALLSAIALEKIKSKKIIFAILVLFLPEASFILSYRLARIPYLNFSNEALYQYLNSDPDIFRVYCSSNCFNPQLLSKYQIETLNGENPIQQTEIVNFLQFAGNYKWEDYAVIFPPYQVWQTNSPPNPNALLLGNANVKYVTSTYELNDQNFNFINKFENVYLYKNNLFKPRFFFKNSASGVNLAKYSPNEINLKFARQKSAKILIVAESYYPGWVASVVNQKFNVDAQNGIIRKIVIPSDTEDVWLKYQPKSYILGKTLTLGSLTFLTLLVLKKRNKKNEKNRNS